jgi:hypothetical protein
MNVTTEWTGPVLQIPNDEIRSLERKGYKTWEIAHLINRRLLKQSLGDIVHYATTKVYTKTANGALWYYSEDGRDVYDKCVDDAIAVEEISYKTGVPNDFSVTLLEVDDDYELGLRAFRDIKSALKHQTRLIMRYRLRKLIGQLASGSLAAWWVEYQFYRDGDDVDMRLGASINFMAI